MEHPAAAASESAPVATMVGGSPGPDFYRLNTLGGGGPGGHGHVGTHHGTSSLGPVVTLFQNGPFSTTDPLGVSTSAASSPSSFSLSSAADSYQAFLPPTTLQPASDHRRHTPDLASSSAHVASLPSVATRSTASMRLGGYGPRVGTRSSARVASMVGDVPEPSRGLSRAHDIGSSSPKEPTVRRRNTRQRKRTARESDDHHDSHASPTKKRRVTLKKPPAGLKKDTDDDKGTETSTSCCICLSEPKPSDLASISGCDHLFCFDCIEKWADRENTCPLCKERFTKIDRVNKRKNSERKLKNSKRVKQKDQRSDIPPGAALEGLLASLTSTAPFPPHRVARLIFSGMGNPFFQISTANRTQSNGWQQTGRRTRSQTQAERQAAAEDNVFSTDTDDETDSGFFSGSVQSTPTVAFSELIRAFPRSGGFVMGGATTSGNGRVQLLRPMSFTHFSPASARSYASNVNDQSAGLGAENPLEIDDSDDEGEVEVIQVTRPV